MHVDLDGLLDKVVDDEDDEEALHRHEDVVRGLVVLEQLHNLDVGGRNDSS